MVSLLQVLKYFFFNFTLFFDTYMASLMDTETEMPYNFSKLKMDIFKYSQTLFHLSYLKNWTKQKPTKFSSVIYSEKQQI